MIWPCRSWLRAGLPLPSSKIAEGFLSKFKCEFRLHQSPPTSSLAYLLIQPTHATANTVVSKPVRFDNPPVVEVVCGVLFSTPQPIKTATLGIFWQTVRDAFPRLEEAHPLPPVIEPPKIGFAQHQVELAFMPPARRTWLSNADGTNLLQIQQDRFLFNWKRAATSTGYPSYAVVIDQFEKHLAQFIEFLKSQGIGEPTYRQYELSYTNLITPENGLSTVGISGVLVDHVRQESATRFLPEPQTFNWVTSYPLPNESGRLHVTAQTAFVPPSPDLILRLDLIARGIPAKPLETSMRSWFDTAHEWITHGFADSTSQILHELVWKRTS